MPSSAFAAITHSQLGAHMTMNGTGNPNSHPMTSTRLRPHTSVRWPETRLASALMTPKPMMKDATSVVDAILNSSEPISGTTVLSRPTMPPTNALIRTSRENCGQLAHKPRVMLGALSAVVICDREPGIERAHLRRLRGSGRDVCKHRAQEGRFIVDPKRFVVA